MNTMVTNDEIRDQLERATQAEHKPTKYPGMTYEQGVLYALRWVTGLTAEEPIEDEDD